MLDWLPYEETVLDKGKIALIDVMGSDSDIAAAARVSYAKGTRRLSDDEKLINYLLRHQHTSPFEMAQLKFYAKAPLFVVAQWVRHRTWAYNFRSYRYSEAPDEFYLPEVWRAQDTRNKQGSEGVVEGLGSSLAEASAQDAYTNYNLLLEMGVAREMARMVLPQSLYTEFYGSVNLHNFLRFYQLRADPHAQAEIRHYAHAMGRMVARAFPLSWQAFITHVIVSRSFGQEDLDIIKASIVEGAWPERHRFSSQRNYEEFYEKLRVSPPTTAKGE